MTPSAPSASSHHPSNLSSSKSIFSQILFIILFFEVENSTRSAKQVCYKVYPAATPSLNPPSYPQSRVFKYALARVVRVILSPFYDIWLFHPHPQTKVNELKVSWEIRMYVWDISFWRSYKTKELVYLKWFFDALIRKRVRISTHNNGCQSYALEIYKN